MKRNYILMLILLLSVFAKSQNVDLNNGLVAYYSFDNDANDASGNRNNGIVQGAFLTEGRVGQCYHFGGVNNSQIIQIPTSNSLKFNSEASFSFWFKLDSYYGMDGWGRKVDYGYMKFFAKNFDRGQISAGINGINNGSFRVDISNNGVGCDATIEGTAINVWHHAVMIVTTGYFRIYIDGKEVAAKNQAMNFNASNSCDLIIGRLAQIWYPIHGCIDEFYVYNRVLADSEVTALYKCKRPEKNDFVSQTANSTNSEYSSNDSDYTNNSNTSSNNSTNNNVELDKGLVAYYPFNGNANNSRGNGYNGTMEGVAMESGVVGQCFYFGPFEEGAHTPRHQIRIKNGNGLIFGEAASFSFWFKLKSYYGCSGTKHRTLNGHMTFFAKDRDNGPRIHAGINGIDDHSFKVQLYNGNKGCEAVIGGNAIDHWYHAVMVITNSYFKIYINGKEVARKDNTMNFSGSNSCDLYLGQMSFDGWYPLDGCLDELRIYNRALSDSEAAGLFFSTGSDICEQVLYNCAKTSNNEHDCDYYLSRFPNGKNAQSVKAYKAETISYNVAKSGGKNDCITYLSKYPNGRFSSEIKSRKNEIIEEENRVAIAKEKEQKRLAQIKINSNKGIWKLGNKLCNCTNQGIIMATLDQWNEDRSMFKGIIVASPGGSFQGSILQKGNSIWFETKNWHICLDEEVESALKNDKSTDAEVEEFLKHL